MNIFADRLKELRKEKNLTQKQLALLLNTTDDSIFSWEKGRAEPSIAMIRTICAILDCTADYLIGLDNENVNKILNYNNYGTQNGNVNFN